MEISFMNIQTNFSQLYAEVGKIWLLYFSLKDKFILIRFLSVRFLRPIPISPFHNLGFHPDWI